MKRILKILTLLGIIASFLWQICLGLCPAP